MDMTEELYSALKELNTLLSRKHADIQFPSSGTPLYQACNIVGQSMDHPFTPPSETTDSLNEICEASGIRYRQIILDGHWWKKNHGPFLGFLKDSQTPVAVLLDPKERYILIHPGTKEYILVNEETAQSLLPLAAVFYRPLPETKLGFPTLFKFTFYKVSNEFFYLFFLGIVAAIIAFFFPFANKVLFDQVIPTFNFSLYTQVILGLILARLAVVVFNATQAMILLRLEGLIGNRAQMALWDRLLKLPVQFFKKIPSGDLIQRTFIVEMLQKELSLGTLRVFFGSIFSLLYLAIMLYYSIALSLVGMSIVFLNIVCTLIITTIKLRYEKQLLASNASINTFLTQIIQGITKIRVAATEQQVFAKWAQEFARNQRIKLSALHLNVILNSINAVLGELGTLLIFGVIIWSLVSETPSSFWTLQHISIGTYLAFNAAFGPFTAAIFSISSSFLSFIKLIPFWERVKPIFKADVERTTDKTQILPKGNIQVENLSFRYEVNGPLVLEGINLVVKPGEFIGIIGPSGSGKSTLFRLLIGFEIPERGVISYDGYDLASLDPVYLRRHIGTILQNSKIFFGTVFDNIVCGGNYTPEEIQEAIQNATFDLDLKEWPMGLDTILPSGGGTLSGGQRQRLLLTRALILRPKILLLDEATSSLDNRTQEIVTHNLEKLKMTRIVIAHRLSTVRHADRIYLFQNGTVVDSGTFDELAQKKNILSSFVEQQAL